MSSRSMPGRGLAILAVALIVTSVAGACFPPVSQMPVPARETVVSEVPGEVAKSTVVTATPPPRQRGGTLVMAISGDPTSLNGIIGNDGNSLPAVCLSQQPLTLGGENWGSAAGPMLAEKWAVSPDGKVWTINLRKDVRWQDGRPFSADDVIFTVKAIQDANVQTGGFRDRFMEGETPIPFEKIDDYTVQATLSQPISAFATNISVPILPQHLLASQDINNAAFNQKPVGTGPFRVTEWRSGESVTLEANGDYWGGAPLLDRWVFRIIPNQDAVSTALQAGDIDFAQIRGRDVPRFLGKPGFKVVTAPLDLSRMIILNHARPFFRDVRVRKALSLAIDRQAVIDAAEQGYGTPADSPFNQAVSMYRAGRLPVDQVDLEQARDLLQAAGWADTNGDGIVEKDGEPFRMTLDYNASWTFMTPVAAYLQGQWKQIGVSAAVRTYDSASFIPAVFRSTDLDKPYDAFINSWGLFGGDPDHYSPYFAPSTPGASPLNYDNEAVKALFDRARVTVDPAVREQLYVQAETLLWEDYVFIALYYPPRIFAYNSHLVLDGAVLDTSRFPPFRYPEKIFFASEM